MISNDFLDQSQRLGWTLIHSLWQSAAIFLLVILLLRLIPATLSRTRYAIACAGIILSTLCVVATYVVLAKSAQPSVANFSSTVAQQLAESNSTQKQAFHLDDAITSISNTLNANMTWIVFGWIIGLALFSLRLISGLWFINRLKNNSSLVGNEWQDALSALASSLGINRQVDLAESDRITTPMIIGFVKPLIVVPTGMLTGLSIEQIETIFLHELAHIKRYDYLINLFQVFIETVFFFNPFVWILSDIIRREREYCCDDDVVKNYGSTLAYAKALATLEELKLSKSTFALALAANKNQLLNRIKRIMEKSGQKYSGKDRLIPAILLIVGFVCASWLTVQERKDVTPVKDVNTIASDTTIKRGKSSKTTIITIGEDGEPHQEVFESIEGDAELFAWTPGLPPIPPDFEITALPEEPFMPAIPMAPRFEWTPHPFMLDTVPGQWQRHGKRWEEFSEEFEKEFSEKFEDFYKKHEKDFEKMMNEMEKKFGKDFESHLGQLESLEHMRIAELAQAESLRALDVLADANLVEIEALSHVPAAAELAALSSDLVDMQQHLDELSVDMEAFERDLKEALVKDGYLKKGEELKSIKWEDNFIEVNGKKINEKDVKRYQEKHGRLFNRDVHVNRIE